MNLGKMKITKIFNFNCAHLHILELNDGPCENLHGHTYKLEVTVESSTSDDFLDDVVRNNIINQMNNCLLIDINSQRRLMDFAISQQWKILVVPYRTTSENLAKWVYTELKQIRMIIKKYDFVRVKLWESPTSYVEYDGERIKKLDAENKTQGGN
jgi:6-pyruvoyltetrahydropterin/6-carboxytetrahydropterin synthase